MQYDQRFGRLWCVGVNFQGVTGPVRRGHEGFAVADLQVIGLCLRKVILEVVDEVYATDPALHLRNSRQIEELILSGLGASVHGFVGGREALISRQFEALRRSQKTEDDNGQT